MISIKELLPNPIGQDTVGEWIELFNNSNETVDLQGWLVKDKSNKTFKLTGRKILPQAELKLNYTETKITLNNDGDAIFLYNPQGELVHQLSYGSSYEGEVISAAQIEELKPESNLSSTVVMPTVDNSIIDFSFNFTPFLIGFLVAVSMGAAIGILWKKCKI